MLVLIEGCDGSGKSTLAQRICDVARYMDFDQVRLLHRGPPKLHPLEEYESPLIDYRPGKNEAVICDRWHVGEVVYPLVLERRSQLTPQMLWHIEAYLLRLGAVLVYVDPPFWLISERIERVGDDLVEDRHLERIVQGYDEAMNQTILPVAHVTDKEITEDTVVRVVMRAVEQESSMRALDEFVTYCGPRFPRILFMGDVRKTNHPEVPTPAFMPAPATSGDYLLRAALTRAQTPWVRRGIGWANACDVDDPDKLWDALAQPAVTALGVHASQRLSLNPLMRVNHAQHPQYVRRFRHRYLNEYGEELFRKAEAPWNS